LKFFAESERGQLDEVNGFAAVGFDDLVADGQGLQFCVYY